MACRLAGAKPLSETMLACYLGRREQISVKFQCKENSSEKLRLKMSSAKWLPFYLGLKVLMGCRSCLLLTQHRSVVSHLKQCDGVWHGGLSGKGKVDCKVGFNSGFIVRRGFGYNHVFTNIMGQHGKVWIRSPTLYWRHIGIQYASPEHQQPWYWLCRMGRSLSYLRKDFNYLCYVSVEEWHKM